MKKVLLFAFSLFIISPVFSQSGSIPNPGFENWTGSVFLNPAGAMSSNNQNAQQGFPANLFRTTDAYHGNYAAQLKTIKSGNDTVAAYFAYGNPGGSGPSGGVPINGTPTGFRVHYKYSIKSADSALIFVQFKKSGTIFAQYTFPIFDTTSTYQLFTQLFSPALTQTPDSIIFGAASSIRVIGSNGNGSGWSPGSVFEIDSVTFTGIATQPAQLNGDLENWQSDTMFTLQGWNIWQNSPPTRTTDAFSGKFAVELVTGSCGGCTYGASPDAITSGTNTQCCGPRGGLPYTATKDTFEFYYKYAPSASNPQDTAQIQLEFHNGANQSNFSIPVTAASSYTKIDFPFVIAGYTPDSVIINIASSSCTGSCNGNIPSSSIGATLKVDAMRFFSQLPVSVSPANPSFCAGTGGVTLQAGGAATYTWAPSTGLSATTGASVKANPLSSTTYTVTGTQGTQASTFKVVVNVNTAPTVSITPSSPSICFGSSVNLTASGTSVSYVWSPSKALNDSLGASVIASPTVTTAYTVTGTSAAGCTGLSSVNVTVNSLPTVTATASKPVICAGGNSVLTANGAVSYTWGPSTGLSSTTGPNVTATPSASSTYTVIGTDSKGCKGTGTVSVDIDQLAGALVTTNTSCFGSCNGRCVANAGGGTSPYTYSWSNGQTTAIAYGLCANTYTLNLKDANGCTNSQTFYINQPTAISLSASSIPTTCGQANGIAMATPSGGSEPYNYSWNTKRVQTGNTATGLTVGNYTVTTTDANGCTATTNVTVSGSSGPSISSSVVPSSCGANNGKATITVSGGASPYSYSWNNGNTTAADTGLSAGTYIATVTDNNGCSTFQAVTVNDASGPSITISSVTDIACNGASNGAISTSVTGGTAPYQYSWSNSATTKNINSLTAGPYQFTVTDANGCTAVQTVNITQPSALVTSANTTQASCGNSDGSVSVTVSGGTSPYTYSWNTGATTTSLSSVGAGTYTVTVNDKDGCSDVTQVSVSNASGPQVTIDSVGNISCVTGPTGVITETTYGGTPPYTYMWSNGKTTANLSGLPAGNYALTVTDNAGCIGTANATVTDAPLDSIHICMVTVDPLTNYNNLLWNPSFASAKVAMFNIYKETTTPGVFGKIGSAPASSGLYVDTLSDARKRSWRYKITQVDSCGNESPMSEPFKTMHLTINLGAGNSINLIWDNFQGVAFNYYIVYRDTVPNVASDSIDYVTNNGIYTYTDPTPPKGVNLYYHMGISSHAECIAAGMIKPHSIEGLNYNASKSNTGQIALGGPTGIIQVSAINSLDIYPNPNTGVFVMNLVLTKQQTIRVKIFNALGQVVETEDFSKLNGKIQKQFDLSSYGKGIYFVQVLTDDGVQYRKVIIQ